MDVIYGIVGIILILFAIGVVVAISMHVFMWITIAIFQVHEWVYNALCKLTGKDPDDYMR